MFIVFNFELRCQGCEKGWIFDSCEGVRVLLVNRSCFRLDFIMHVLLFRHI